MLAREHHLRPCGWVVGDVRGDLVLIIAGRGLDIKKYTKGLDTGCVVSLSAGLRLIAVRTTVDCAGSWRQDGFARRDGSCGGSQGSVDPYRLRGRRQVGWRGEVED